MNFLVLKVFCFKTILTYHVSLIFFLVKKKGSITKNISFNFTSNAVSLRQLIFYYCVVKFTD
jgi:hypothetical protein